MTEYTDTVASKERLAADLRQLITDAESLVAETAHNSESKIIALRERVTENLHTCKACFKPSLIFPSFVSSARWLPWSSTSHQRRSRPRNNCSPTQKHRLPSSP